MPRLIKFIMWLSVGTVILLSTFTPVMHKLVEHAVDYFMENYAGDYDGDYDDDNNYDGDDGDYVYDDYDSNY